MKQGFLRLPRTRIASAAAKVVQLCSEPRLDALGNLLDGNLLNEENLT